MPIHGHCHSETYIPLALWEGRVLDANQSCFTAVVLDQMNRETPEEEAEIPMDEVSEGDRDLVAVGAPFSWSIGYRIRPSGQRSRESMIRFQRLPR